MSWKESNEAGEGKGRRLRRRRCFGAEGEGEGGRKETKREERAEEHSEGIQEGTPRVGCRRKKDVGESSKRKDKVDVGGQGRFNSLARNWVVGLDGRQFPCNFARRWIPLLCGFNSSPCLIRFLHIYTQVDKRESLQFYNFTIIRYEWKIINKIIIIELECRRSC